MKARVYPDMLKRLTKAFSTLGYQAVLSGVEEEGPKTVVYGEEDVQLLFEQLGPRKQFVGGSFTFSGLEFLIDKDLFIMSPFVDGAGRTQVLRDPEIANMAAIHLQNRLAFAEFMVRQTTEPAPGGPTGP